MATLDKIQVVLLKKSGQLPPDSTASNADIQRYKELYGRLLPPNFIDAVTSLVSATRKGGAAVRKKASSAVPTAARSAAMVTS